MANKSDSSFFRRKLSMKTLAALGEDFRKLGVTGVGAGLVGLVVSGDSITPSEAVFIAFVGLAFWIYGTFLTETVNSSGDLQ